jgi:dephospho-CoA kinase
MRRMTDLAETDEVVVLDVPLLVESSRAYPVAGLLVVDVDPDVAVERLVAQRGMPEADARARIAKQASRDERLARADRVIDNHGSLADLERQVDEAWAWITTLAAGSGTDAGESLTPEPKH